jgi:hypothetical protein
VEPLVDIMRAAQEFHPEIIRAAPQSMLRFTHDINCGSSLPKLLLILRQIFLTFV